MIHLIETRFLVPVPPCPRAPSYEPAPTLTLVAPPQFESISADFGQNPSLKTGNIFAKPPVQEVFFLPDAILPSVGRAFSSSKQHNFSPNFSTKINQLGGSKTSGKIDSNMENRLELVAAHISRIDNKLSSLQQQLDSNSLSAATGLGPQEELLTSASENYRVDVGVGSKRQSLYKVRIIIVERGPVCKAGREKY